MQFEQQYSQSFEIQELNGVIVYGPVAKTKKRIFFFYHKTVNDAFLLK